MDRGHVRCVQKCQAGCVLGHASGSPGPTVLVSRKAKEAKAELKEPQSCQLEFLAVGARSLEDVLKRRSTVEVLEAHRELSISLDKFKTSLLESITGRTPVSGLRRVWANRAELFVEMCWIKLLDSRRRPRQASRETCGGH